MRQFYNVTEKIKETLLNEPFINTLTYGDISEVDLDEKTIFPLAHMIVDSVEINGPTMNFDISILFIGICDISKENTVDKFVGNDNTQDILNTQLAVIGRLCALMYRGELWDNKIHLVGEPSAQPFSDRFENKLAGWSLDFTVQVPNDSTIC